MHSRQTQQVKYVLRWCQAPPRLPLVLNDICDIHGQDLKSQLSKETVQLGNFDIALLLFFLQMCSSLCDLQHALGWLKCEAAGMRISNSNSEAMSLCQKRGNYSVRVEVELELERRFGCYTGQLCQRRQTQRENHQMQKQKSMTINSM